MLVRAKKAMATRKLVNGQPPQVDPAQPFTFPAPIRGWILNENLANVQPAGARILDNWFCTTTGIRVRGGSVKYATISGTVQSLFAYAGGAKKFFAANTTGIYDITAPSSPTTPVTAAVTGRTSGKYATTQIGTAGGSYLYAVNGVDKPLLYDGSTWTAIDGTSTPAITGVTTTSLKHVWTFANRLFFIEKDTLTAWYLSVDSIGGAAQSFSLAGVFPRGGSLLFGGKWSLDAGDGLDDKCVFVSSEGEIAVYEGTNPGSASDWRLAGVYQMPKALGLNGHTQAGGDLLISTEIGLIPVSAAIQNDLGALGARAVSAPVAPYWQELVSSVPSGWEVIKSTTKGLMFVTAPDGVGTAKVGLAVNLLTGAWSRITGWDMQCLANYADNPYFGSADGCVYLMDSGGSDAGSIYTATYLGQSETMGVPGRKKTVVQMKPMFQIGSPINPLVGALADFDESLMTAPSSVGSYATDAWDQGQWDVAVWDAGSSLSNSARWVAVGVTGDTIAPVLQLSFGVTPTPAAELVSIDAMYRLGASVA